MNSMPPNFDRTTDDRMDVGHAAAKPFVPSIVRDLSRLVEAGAKYSTVYADPPWPYSNTAARGAAENHYRTMNSGRHQKRTGEETGGTGSPPPLVDHKRFSPRSLRRHPSLGVHLQIVFDLGQTTNRHGQLLASLPRVPTTRRSRKSPLPQPDRTKLATRPPNRSQSQAILISQPHRTGQPRSLSGALWPRGAPELRLDRLRKSSQTQALLMVYQREATTNFTPHS